MTRRIVLIACAWGGFLAVPPAIHAWGCEGHQIVATIAGSQLTPNARAQVNKLLKNNPIDPQLKRFCKSKGLTNMQDGATWADDIRTSNGTAEEHFVDIPRADTSGNVVAACPDKCITKAMSSNLDKLKSSSSSDKEKADALRYLLHYAGDIHQPLHCADNNDRGGNCVLVRAVTPQSKVTEPMHSAWDKEFVRAIMNGGPVTATATALSKKFKTDIATWKSGSVDVDAWALESHKIAEDIAYEKLPGGGPKAEPSANPPVKVCPEPAKPAIQLNAAYRDAAQTVIPEQLAKGGARLALMLNSVWP
ncbi:MAG TPA: S1/P1 nuclease [Thermoanaerobaculia bacterium]|nr:S1/P1 nuclease [Thermoanaerobaculia bacterium]